MPAMPHIRYSLLIFELKVFQEEADQASELSDVFWCGVELVLELNKSASIWG